MRYYLIALLLSILACWPGFPSQVVPVPGGATDTECGCVEDCLE